MRTNCIPGGGDFGAVWDGGEESSEEYYVIVYTHSYSFTKKLSKERDLIQDLKCRKHLVLL